MLLDSNIIIYSLLPEHPKLRQFIETHLPAASGISYLEVLGFHKITPDDKARFVQLFEGLKLLEIDRKILDKAVFLRQQRKMSIGDAVIAATALVHDRTLITRNVDDFRWIPELRLLNPFEAA
jgi:predicted nucleic acid-binding protein